MKGHNFGAVPSVNYARAKNHCPYGVKTTMNVGKLYPIDVVEVVPGDTFKCNMTGVIRATSSFIKPIMDNLVFDTYHFFVPYRLVFSKATEVFGKASPSMYTNGILEKMPAFASSVSISEGSVGDYLGIALGKIPKGLTVLAYRAFAKIWNEWFRNESIDDETYVQMGVVNGEAPNSNAWSASNYTGMLPSVGKRKDYFTSLLPAPQKGMAVDIPVTLSGSAPIMASNDYWLLGQRSPAIPGQTYTYVALQGSQAAGLNPGRVTPDLSLASSSETGLTQYQSLRPNPEYVKADLNGVFGSGFSVNDLRSAVAVQRMLEKDARIGSRYNEFLLGHFNVVNPDARLQFTEFLGGGSFPIMIQQVAQTSESSVSSPLANVAGFSLSNGKSYYNKGFTEHGFVFTVGCIRQVSHDYCQGVPKMFTKTERAHFYDPLFAHVSEQPVYKSEIYVDTNTQASLRDDTQILGYNEAWADYRWFPNKLTGQMRTTNSKSLSVWHLGDLYSNAPVLNSSFIHENADNVDRCLSIPSSGIDNFICDFYFDLTTVRVMPLYSVPGLVDHDVV